MSMMREIELSSDITAIAQARKVARDACVQWALTNNYAIELVTAELVTNAVFHAGGPCCYRIKKNDENVDVEVEDKSPTPPVVQDWTPSTIGGLGLHIVESLAEWDWKPTGCGKVVTAHLNTHASDMAGHTLDPEAQ